MRRILSASIGILCILVLPFSLHAQQFKDCRVGGGCTEEDYARTLFPDERPTSQYRGVPSPGAPSPGASSPNTPLASAPSATPPAMALDILFGFNSDKILPKYYPELDKLGRVLTQYPNYRIGIEGHTDDIGSDRYNQMLSERRAESVKGYLVQRYSIEARRLDVKGYGESRPLVTNDTSQGQEQNRRVQVVNLGRR